MAFLYHILIILLGMTALVVLLSYLFTWYELANQEPGLMDIRFEPRHLWFALKVFVRETLCVYFSFLLRPVGWIFFWERIRRNGTGPHIILLHGLFQDRTCWLWIKYRLRGEGFRNLHTVNLPPWHNAEALTERIAKKVDRLRLATGVQKVHLIGHSMGGLLARNYIQVRGGAAKVGGCILLGSPNHGSRLAPFALSPLAKLLIPGSEFLKRLAAVPLPAEIPVTAIYSRHDNLVQPFSNARLEGAHNAQVSGLGHISLLYSNEVYDKIITSLRGFQHEDNHSTNPRTG